MLTYKEIRTAEITDFDELIKISDNLVLVSDAGADEVYLLQKDGKKFHEWTLTNELGNDAYLEDDGNLTPTEAVKTKKGATVKPVYILASSREDAIKKLVAWLKDDRRLTLPLMSKRSKFKKDTKSKKAINASNDSLTQKRVEKLVEEDQEEALFEKDVLARRSISPLVTPPRLVFSDSWRLALEGIFLEMIRIYWLLSRHRQLKEVTIHDKVKQVGDNHPVKAHGFLLTSASSAIDVVLSDKTVPSPSSVYTTLSYLTVDHKERVDYHLILNARGIKAMERFVDHFSRPSEMREELFDTLNVRLIVSSSRHFTIEPYLRLKAISYIS